MAQVEGSSVPLQDPKSPGQELRALSPQKAPKNPPVRLGSSMVALAAFSAAGRSMPEATC